MGQSWLRLVVLEDTKILGHSDYFTLDFISWFKAIKRYSNNIWWWRCLWFIFIVW